MLHSLTFFSLQECLDSPTPSSTWRVRLRAWTAWRRRSETWRGTWLESTMTLSTPRRQSPSSLLKYHSLPRTYPPWEPGSLECREPFRWVGSQFLFIFCWFNPDTQQLYFRLSLILLGFHVELQVMRWECLESSGNTSLSQIWLYLTNPSYDECNVNSNKMMNLGTGHATVPLDGDYLLTFSANMVSSDSQAVWCALYKQSPGDQGWQVR